MAPAALERAKRYTFEPDYAVPPGRTLQETIDALGMDQRELATRTGLSPKHINQIIQGVAPVTQETAVRLERVTGAPARFWSNLEMNYREQLAKLEERTRLADDLTWLKEIPVNELIKRGKIQKQLESALLIREVLGFFGVANVEAWRQIWKSPSIDFRKSKAFRAKLGALATWIRLGEIEAQDTLCQPFDRAQFRAALEQTRSLTVKPPEVFVPKMKTACAAAGVAVALVPEIKGAPVCGATQWLTPEKALLQLSIRYKTNDQFWFSFFHEAGHILLGGKKDKFIDVDHEDGESEEGPNRFAADFLIPHDHAKMLGELQSAKTVVRFARSIGIAPGIVVGRLQREKIIPYNYLNHLKEKFRWAKSN